MTSLADAFDAAMDQAPTEGGAPRYYRVDRWWAQKGGVVGRAVYYADVDVWDDVADTDGGGSDVQAHSVEQTATVREARAFRRDGRVAVEGALLAPTTGWTVELRAGNPGVAGDHDDRLFLILTATPPEVGGDAMTDVTFGDSFPANSHDREVGIRLVGAVDEQGRDAIVIPIG